MKDHIGNATWIPSFARSPFSAITCILFALHFWSDRRVLNWDVEAYYHYLPAAIIRGDVRELGYVASVDSVMHPDHGQMQYGMFTSKVTGWDCSKYPCGVALFELPMFLVAHAYCICSHTTHAADGYSAPYHLAVSLSTILFVFLGLLVLRRFLLRCVTDRAAAIALIVLAFGTNLFFYSTVDSGMSHGYMFFLFACILERTDAWHRKPTRNAAIGLGLAFGLVLITRPVDITVAIVPLLWPHPDGVRAKWRLVLGHRDHLAVAILAAFIPLIPQLLYWKATTGSFLFYTYRTETFNWGDPHVLDGLFSYRKGWFVYSPLVLLGFLGLALMLAKKAWRPLAWPLVAFFPVAFYITFSWYQWWYGGGFGARPLVDTLPLLALPIAVLTTQALRTHLALALALTLIVLAGVHLNLFQQKQYLSSIIHWDSMTKERYWEVWGHENWEGLRSFP